MKRIATLAVVVSLFATAGFAAIDGAWTASREEKHPDRLYFSITRGESHQNGMTMSVSALSGLTAAIIDAKTMTPVQFETRREAGTIAWEGTFRSGKGAGQFTFTPNRAYIDALRTLGVPFDLGRHERRSSEEENLFTLALFDVSTAYIRTMIAEGYRVSLEDYLSMRIFDITPDYIHEMRSLGFSSLSSDDLVSSRIHGVTAAYVRETRAFGWKLDLDELQASRIHGATPAFAEKMKAAGYPNLAFDDLVSFRIHGVTPEVIETMRKLGYDHLSADDLISIRIHGVTPEYIHELADAGYVNIPIEKLIDMRIHGIDAKFITKMSK
jgi:hypothetical protein